MQGIKTTEITAGQYKRVASQYAPLSESGRASIQDTVDYLYSIFVGAVAKARGVSEDKVLQDMADGRVFIGQQAIAAGLVDGVSTLEGAIARVRQLAAGVAATQTTLKAEGETMDRESILAAHPELAEAFRAEGATAERARILGVEAQTMPGHEALVATLKADGRTSPEQAAMQILTAERTKLGAMAGKLSEDAPKPVIHASAPSDAAAAPAKNSREALHAKAKAYQAEHPGTDLMAALRAVQTA